MFIIEVPKPLLGDLVGMFDGGDLGLEPFVVETLLLGNDAHFDQFADSSHLDNPNRGCL